VASFRAFMAGAFSSDKSNPAASMRPRCARSTPAVLRAVFQVQPANPLVGLEGRAGLLQRLGDALAAEAGATACRPGRRCCTTA
jgi:hypothetical protein